MAGPPYTPGAGDGARHGGVFRQPARPAAAGGGANTATVTPKANHTKINDSTATISSTANFRSLMIVDPALDPPADNGGPAKTMAQQTGSLDLNAATCLTRLTRDQRGGQRTIRHLQDHSKERSNDNRA